MSHKRKIGIPIYAEKFLYINEHQTRQWLRKEIINLTRNNNLEIAVHNLRVCPITWEKKQRVETPCTLHHAKVHNTWWNQDRYPLLYNSLLNLMATTTIQNDWSSFGKISAYQADGIERFLERHPKAEAFVNRLEPLGYFKEG